MVKTLEIYRSKSIYCNTGKNFFFRFFASSFLLFTSRRFAMTTFSAATACAFRPARFCDPRSAAHRATVAVSACLAGEKVRYDGADKLLPCHPLLARELNLIAICPEMGAGLGVPRPPVQLIDTGAQIAAIGRENAQLDVTAALQRFAENSFAQLRERALCGYLWKSRSPSCGFGSTPIFDPAGVEFARGDGIQAACFRQRWPQLCHREETALDSALAASSFVLRCRIVFDVLYTAATARELHRHYEFLHNAFTEPQAMELDALRKTNDKNAYLTAFQQGCNQISDAMLLSLFR